MFERRLRLIIKGFFGVVVSALVLTGCSNKINQTGAWLVSTDSSQVPTYFDSRADSASSTTTQVNIGLATGASSKILLGKVPWTEADLLIGFSALDSVDSAQKILSGTISLRRTPYSMQVAGESINNMTFAGYAMDSSWTSTTFTWDSVNAVGYGSQNFITSTTLTDSTVVISLDTTLVRRWALATSDSNFVNNGMIIKPLSTNGVFSVYSPVYGTTGFIPLCTVVFINKAGTLDTISTVLSYATSVAQTSLVASAPQGNYGIVQAGTGERENVSFDLSKVPRLSVINKATLTLTADTTAQAPYTRGGIVDSLIAYYTTDLATGGVSAGYPALGVPDGNRYTFDVTTILQHMVNTQNNGFMILQSNELNNIDARFLYNGSAPDSLRPRLTVTYTPTSRK